MRTTRALALAVALSAAPAVAAADDDSRPGLAVLRAENRAASPWWDEVGAQRAQGALIAQLEAGNQYRVMAPDRIAEILASERIWLTGELSPATAARVGRELGVRYLVASILVEFGTGARGTRKRSNRKLLGLGGLKSFKTQIILRLIDTEFGRTIWSDSRRAETELGKALAAPVEEGARAEETVFEQTLLPLLADLAAQLPSAPIEPPAEENTPGE